MPPRNVPDRNLALELVRVTEAAALQAARHIGRGDKEAADQAAVDGMHAVLHTVQMDGIVVIGEGEKDEAPMLHNGEQVGNGQPRALQRVDRDVDLRGRAVADPFAVVQHRRLVLLALADHHDAVHLDRRQHVAHRIHGRLVGSDLVAEAHPAGRGQRRRLGHADELERQVAVRSFGHGC